MSAVERADLLGRESSNSRAALAVQQHFLRALLAPNDPATQTTKPEKKPKRESLDKQVRAILEADGGNIKAPRIHVEVALIQHGNERDAAALAQSIRSADIVVPELSHASERDLATLQALADGTVTPEEVAEDEPYITEFFLAFCVAVYKSGARIAHVDAKQGSPYVGERRQTVERIGSLLGPIIRQEVPFEQACTDIAQAAALDADSVLRQRNELMLDNLGPAIANVVRANPSLQYPQKKSLKVFMYLGALHGDVPKQLKKSGTKVTTVKHRAGTFRNHTEDAQHKSTEGKPLNAADGRKLLLEFVFDRLYGFVKPHLKGDDVFAPLEELGLGTMSPRIFTDVFLADAEEIYTNCPPELSSSLRNLPSVRQVIVDYYEGLIQKRRSTIVRKVNRLVTQIQRTPQIS